MNLQFFGGRGATSPIPDGGTPGGGSGGDQNFTGNIGPRVYSTAAEALGAKGAIMSPDRATIGANPNYSPEYSEYSENCQRCVVTYEARRRGYNVTAQPTYAGDTMPNGNNWTRNFVGARVENVGASTTNAVQKRLEQKMKDYGNGSRAVVSVEWKGCTFGHVINVEQKGGKTIYRDAQTGVQYKGKNFFTKVNPRTVTVTRVDNLSFSDSVGEAVTKDRY